MRNRALIVFLILLSSNMLSAGIYIDSSINQNSCTQLVALVELNKNLSIKQKLERLNIISENFKESNCDQCLGKVRYAQSNYHRSLGNYDSAKFFISQSMVHYQNIKDSLLIAEAINLDGIIDLARQHYGSALSKFITSLKYGKHNADSLWIAVIYLNIGNIYQARKEYQKSLKYYKKTLAIYHNSDQVAMKIQTFNNLATSHQKMGALNQAEKYFNQALEYAFQEKDSFSISLISQNIGHLLIKKKAFDKSRDYFVSAKPVAESLDDTFGVAYCLLGLGLGYHGESDYLLAKSNLNDAIHLAKGISANELLEKAYQHLYKIDSATGNFEEAFSNYQKFKTVQDSIFWQLQAANTEEMLVKYETREREKDNEILQAMNSLQDEKLTKQSYIITFVIIILFVMVFSVYHTRKVNRLLVKNAETVEKQKSRLEQQAKELLVGNKVTKEINLNLEKIVKSRTLKIHQQNTALRNYEFENSHRVRGPLARILGLVSLFEVEKLSEEQRMLVMKICESATELDEIIRNMSKVLGKA